MSIHRCSHMSLYIEMLFNGNRLATGTAFLTKINNKIYLLTNRHNVTGRSQVDGKPLHPSAGIPNELKIYLPSVEKGKWTPMVKELYSSTEDFLWIEHPQLKEKADFVLLEVIDLKDVSKNKIICNFINFDNISKVQFKPSERVSIIGFPFGHSAGSTDSEYYPIWLNGFVASEMKIDYKGLPVFLIDARTREGQSGSPVWSINDKTMIFENNKVYAYNDKIDFLGIYSGRINESSDIGFVWKASAILDLVNYVKNQNI